MRVGLQDKKVALFCPVFFNYEKEITKSIEKLGAHVMWYDDRPSNSFFSKVVIRLNRDYLASLTQHYYNKIISAVPDDYYDYLLFINPEAITEQILQEMRRKFASAKFIIYMWDSFRNRKKTLALLPYFDLKFTFDPKDATDYEMKFRPLFYIPQYERRNNRQLIYDLLFTGTAHSDRYFLVRQICQQLDSSLKTKLYFFLGSKTLFYLKKMLDKKFRGVKLKDLSFKSLNHAENATLIEESKAVLDINHPRQIGLTMRTFEVMGSWRKLITTNPDITNYDFFNKNNILIIDRDNPVIDHSFFESPMIDIPNSIRRKYSIEGWTSEIFELTTYE